MEEVGDEGQLGLGVQEEVGCFGGFCEVGSVVDNLEQSYNDCYKNSRNCQELVLARLGHNHQNCDEGKGEHIDPWP